ncbi:MAG: glycosyltransferase [Anaerolineae bacterium]|nr:glycosyltransferase [Gemmatimonadaceae bacterium]
MLEPRQSGESAAKPVVSVVIVSDYAGGEAKAWDDVRATLEAFARQDFGGEAEFLLSESSKLKSDIPAELRTILPTLKLIFSEPSTSYDLKNQGVQAAAADFVAIIDADCIPDSGWLRHLVETLRGNPDAVAVSGRTVYEGRSLLERLLSLLSRSYLDPGRAGATRFISNNNAGYRRSMYLKYPLPTGSGAFAARLQSDAISRAGGKLLFEPRMRVVHDFEGWAMERDIRRNIGYGTIITRLRERLLPFAWLTRLGPASIPLFTAGKTLNSWADCLRCARHYGVRWYELPFALALAVVVNLMEISGMVRAFRGSELERTAYR